MPQFPKSTSLSFCALSGWPGIVLCVVFARRAGIAAELLVTVINVDEADVWAQAAHRTDGFVIPVLSHDIPEAMAYNRLAKMARGHVIMIIPDDMVLNLADDCSWVRNIQTLFERLPLAVFSEPIALRRRAFLHVGGFDEGTASLGKCSNQMDLCHRMWASGYQVLWMQGPAISKADVRDTHAQVTHSSCISQISQTGGRSDALFRRWGARDSRTVQGFAERAKEANKEHMVPWGTMWQNGQGQRVCPYPSGCTRFEEAL
uniref:Glycosyltransferase 2-like domain-containing protein n=1 Tax=Chlamydomonas euryale TaxID=1486919 RepID=A0A7R9V636_9CHLO|mmetsp:Transcript_21052/g.62977  ORF Transcript_21052/g.62977 Transcript_21052/m.62977 type:complete len:260 (+) Transcript_21052:1587-2366(+)